MNLHERMKQYEKVSQTHLMRKTPVVIRLDGVAFHTFTRNFNRPFDEIFGEAMRRTTQELVDNIQGCVLGYTQSDEISLVLQDYKKHDTDAWFGYNVQKLVSVSAKMATYEFYKAFKNVLCGYDPDKCLSIYWSALKDNNVGFDSRCFNLPFDEVNNYLIDRQRDAENNSLNLLGQQYYTQEELFGVKSNQLQNKLFTEKGINWNDLPDHQKRGYFALPKYDPNLKDLFETPMFSKEPEFVNSLIKFNEEENKNE